MSTNPTNLNNTTTTLNNTNLTTLNNTNNTTTTLNNTPACAACKHQRRKCTQNCLLARYFPATETSSFLNAHKLFGVKKIANMLQAIPEGQRAIAAQTIIVQGNARAADPSGGCLRMVCDLTRQIESYQAQLAVVNTHLESFKAQENGFVANGVVNGVVNSGNGYENNNSNGFVGGQMLMDLEFEGLFGDNSNIGGLQFRNNIGMNADVELVQRAFDEDKELKVAASMDFSEPGDFINKAEDNERSVYRPPPVIAPFGTRVRQPTQNLQAGQAENIPAPFLWATTKRANTHCLEELQLKQIYTITGQMQCKKCEHQFDMEYNLQEKFYEVESFIRENKYEMRDRAPSAWKKPVLLSCRFCGKENCVRPVISRSKKTINWLFLFLGQMLGCLTLAQLKYFCKHNGIHRTGAKDRLLYLTYMSMRTQLSPGIVDQDG